MDGVCQWDFFALHIVSSSFLIAARPSPASCHPCHTAECTFCPFLHAICRGGAKCSSTAIYLERPISNVHSIWSVLYIMYDSSVPDRAYRSRRSGLLLSDYVATLLHSYLQNLSDGLILPTCFWNSYLIQSASWFRFQLRCTWNGAPH